MRRNTKIASAIVGAALTVAMTTGVAAGCSTGGGNTTQHSTHAATVNVGGYVSCTSGAAVDKIVVTPAKGASGDASIVTPGSKMGTRWTYSGGSSTDYSLAISCGTEHGSIALSGKYAGNNSDVTCSYNHQNPAHPDCSYFVQPKRG
ncbi:MAG: hypothetical protein ACQR33_03665 [Candidatus Saccharibacteria bacterium]